MSNYMTKTVQNLVNRIGEEVVYRRKTGISKNVTDMTQTVTFATPITVKASVRRFKDTELSGLAQEGDREVRIAADDLSFQPQAQDIIEIKTKAFNVVAINFRSAFNEDSVFIIRVRGTNPLTA